MRMATNFLLLKSCTFTSARGSDEEITIHKGALIEKTRSGYIYQHRGDLAGSKCRPTELYHTTRSTDVMCKDLNQRQFELLSGISEDESRYRVYATGRLEWGCSVKNGDDVFVKRRGIDKPVAATICCVKKNDFGVEIKDPDCKYDRAASDNGKIFVTQAKKMNIDAYVALDKLYKDPDQIFDNSKPYYKCSNDHDDEATAHSNNDTPKLNYCKETTLDQRRTHSSTFELSKDPRIKFEEVKADKSEHEEINTGAQADSYYIEKFEQERKRRMEAEEKIKQARIENEYTWKKFREMDIKQKNEIAQLQIENEQLKLELSDSQKAIDQYKDTIGDLTQYGEVYQKELQDLQETIDRMKEEFDQMEQECNQVKQECDQMKQECDRMKQERGQLEQERDQMKQERDHVTQECDQMKQECDHCMAENALLENQIEALGAIKEQFSSLLPAYQWKIDHEELIITANVLGKGAWGFVKEGTFHGTKVAVKGVHQAIISVADEIIQSEFYMMAEIRHPNLVLLIGIVFNDPRHKGPLIITELLDCNMRSAYEEGKLDRPCRLPLLRDVAAALNYLHSRKRPLIHRDISSANVMLEASGNGKWKRAKLCDFGSAKLTSHASTPVPGAAIYSAPETLPVTKGEQTVKVDVYSFGVLYTEILLARLPPDLDPTTDDFSKFISDLKRLEGPGEDLYHTAHTCTNKNPKKRPTMNDVLHNIDRHITASTTL